jgi:N-acetylmuramoyl-L-alanine amidase
MTSTSKIDLAIESVINLVNAMGNFATMTRGALGTANSLACEIAPSTPLEVYYDKKRKDNSNKLASYVLKAAVAATGAKNRETRDGNSLIVLNKSNVPAILVECGFISSNEECLKLVDPEYQKVLAQGIANGIYEFMPPVETPEESGQAPE